MKKAAIFVLMLFLTFGFVFSSNLVIAHHDNVDLLKSDNTNSERGQPAPSDSDSSSDDSDNDDDSDDDNSGRGNSRTVEVEREFYIEDGNRVRIITKTITKTITNSDGTTSTNYRVRIKGEEINSRLEIRQSDDGTRIRARVRGGDEDVFIDLLPDEIAEIVREQIGSGDLNITLEERVHKNVPRVVYNVRINTHGKFLGIFKLRMRAEAQVDPETGEILGVTRPWWAFLVSEDDDETGEEENETEIVETTELCEIEDPTFEVDLECQALIDTNYPERKCTFELANIEFTEFGSCIDCVITCDVVDETTA